MTIPHILAIIFSVASAIYIFIGIYALYLDPRRKTNILFFAMSLSLSIWSFGFSMSIGAETLSVVLFWRRFAALGFGSLFSIMLHFFITFTNNKTLGCRKIFYVLLYSPTIVVYLGFTYFPKLNPKQYNMIQTPMGWTNIAVNNIWDIFFIVYYVTYSLASLYLLWNWGRRSHNIKDKKTSRAIIISFLFAMLIGSVIDMLGNIIFSTDVLQLSPILVILPAVVIYYHIRKRRFLSPEDINENAILMSDQIRAKVSSYISAGFVFASMINFVARYFFTDNNGLVPVLLSSGFFVLIAFAVQLTQRYINYKNIKDIIIATLFSLAIPILTFRYLNTAGATVWALPFVLLIVSILFDNSFFQIIISVSIILTQVVMWILMPEATITIGNASHLVRLGIFLFAIWFARFSSRIFQSKLIENAEQIGLQKITTGISTEFISVNDQNLNEKMTSALDKLGTFLNTDRVYIFIFDDDKSRLICHSQWKSDSVVDNKDIDNQLNVSDYPEFIRRVQIGDTITIPDISISTSFSGDELPRLLGSIDKSFVAMPIIIKSQVYGFFGIDSKTIYKPWPETQLDFFRIISLIFSATFERIQQEQEITELAFYDYITKLPNRFLFKDRVSNMIALSKRTNSIISVIFINLNAFKTINDSIGHDGGDTLIVKLAEQLTKTLRKSDTVARFGGDEFLIMLTNLSSTDVIQKIVHKILHIFDSPFVINEQEFFVTASAGIAVYPYDGKDADTLIKNADIAMYKSKELGKNKYMFCTEDMREEVLFKMRLTNNLFRVLDNQELKLYYQPQVCTKSRRIIGVEALIRWFHPQYGIINPGLFIPLAEQTGLIGSIGGWVLREACRQCKEWHSKGLTDIRIAVNVSLLQLKHPKFVRDVKLILNDTQLDAKYLELELTESAAVSNSDYIINVLYCLKNLGITISIDDFGTEYSSLSRLSTMPIDKIKLDMQFIHSIGNSDKENAIIKSIIDLSHTLGLNVVAEGVETEPQLDFLTEYNSDIIQGFYFYHPLPPDEFEKIYYQNK